MTTDDLKKDCERKAIEMKGGYSVIFDAEDYEKVSKYHWCPFSNNNGRVVYAICYHKENKVVKNIRMHRLIMGAKKGQFVDHINHNGLDNRKCNLRIASKLQNNQNKNIQRNKHELTSIYKGVSYVIKCKCYRAQISVNDKKINLGNYKTEIEAAIKYDLSAIKYHGEFAHINFPILKSESLIVQKRVEELEHYKEIVELAEKENFDFNFDHPVMVQCVFLENKVDEQQKQIDSLQKELSTQRTKTWCAYCGKDFPADNSSAEQVGDHIQTCPKHPKKIREYWDRSNKKRKLARRLAKCKMI